MERNELMDKIASGQMTRREFKKALAAVGLGLFTVPFMPKVGRAEPDDHPIVFTWEGYEDEAMHEAYTNGVKF